jgi:hypothetical protein
LPGGIPLPMPSATAHTAAPPTSANKTKENTNFFTALRLLPERGKRAYRNVARIVQRPENRFRPTATAFFAERSVCRIVGLRNCVSVT